jgi:two-component system LytT family response regulator
MNTLEKSLDPEIFTRIHRSTIANVNRIKELQPALHGEYVVTLQDGMRLQSGRVYNDKLKALSTNPF